MTSNPKQISGLGATVQVRDNTDVVHTGIIKALNTMASGNKVISGCDITQQASTGGSSAATTQFSVANGQYLQDNQLVAFSANTIKLNTAINEFTNPAGIQVPHASNDYYALLVIDTAGALKIRGDNTLASSTPVVASYTLGDTLLAVIKITGGSAANLATRELQFLTTSKVKNAVGVAHDDGGTYTETLSIIGGVGGASISNKVGNLSIQDGSTGGIIIAGNDVGIGGTVPTVALHAEAGRNNAYLSLIKNTDSAGSNFAGGLTIHANGSTANHRFIQCYDYATSKEKLLFTSDGTLSITAHEATAATLKLQSDEADDAGDSWAFISKPDQTLTIANNIASAGTHVDMITFTPHATAAQSSITTTGSLTVSGDLTVGGGDIIGPTDGALTIKADTDMIFRIDSDSDGAETFQFQTNNGNEVMSLDEAGNLQIDGDLNISGGNLATTAVTANALFTTGAGLTNAPDNAITNSGFKNEAFVFRAGLTASESGGHGDLGHQIKVIEPTLLAAVQPGNIRDVRQETIYLGLRTKCQIGLQEMKEAGNATHADYDLMVQGTFQPPTNGLIGGGGFVCLPSPDVSARSTTKVTLVNTSNVPCYVLSTQQTGIGGWPAFHKGLKTRDFLRTNSGQNTVDLSRCLTDAVFAAVNLDPLANITSGGSQDAYLLKAGASVTLHAIQLTQESNPAYLVQDTQGWYPQDPRAFWMVKSSSENNTEAKISYITHQASTLVGPAQSGHSLFFNHTGGAQTLILPPTPAVGTQYFIYNLSSQTLTLMAANPTNGTINCGGTTANDVIRDSGSDVNTKAVAQHAMLTLVYGPDSKWLVIG
jgi:hypothetical protein